MSQLLEDEIKWIEENSHRYDSQGHKRAAIENIKKRYRIKELEGALKNVQRLIFEGAQEGFNCHRGDWAERLFHSQQRTSKALNA